MSCTVWELWDKRPEEGQTSYLLPDSSSALRGPSFLALERVGKDLRASTSALLSWLAVAWHLIPLALTLSYSRAGGSQNCLYYTHTLLLLLCLPPGMHPSQPFRLHLHPPAGKPLQITLADLLCSWSHPHILLCP